MSKILIADDIEENRYFLEALLRGHGHQVLTAMNGAEALEIARKETPDLIVTDILMPVMDGFALCKGCKSDTALANIPFVFYTATYTDRKDRTFGLSLGAERYLVKPLEPDELINILHDVLEQPALGRAKQADEKMETETCYLREHNDALSRKLESKMAQLEKANQCLRQELAERRQAEIQLQRLYTAIENATECIVIANSRGDIEYVNPAFEKITGFTKNDTLSLNPDIMPSGVHDESFYRSLWQSISLKESWTGQLKKKHGNGEPVELDITTSPIADASGEISGSVLVMRDVTRQKKLEDQLLQSQKIQALGTLAGGIAHDFNNILSAIIGYTDLTLFDAPREGRIRANLMAVLSACDRAKSLVKQILTFSRKADHDVGSVDLCPLIKETMKFLAATLPSNIEIRTRLEPVFAYMMTDPVRIYQVILNIGTNAAYAMRETGGILEVVLRRVELDENTARQHATLKPGEYLLLSVSDTGCGMSGKTLSRVFEPFFTTKKEGEGTGLGLALVHGIVQSHGGAITVYSEEGCGSTFNIYLPASESSPKEEEQTDKRPLPVGTERILFVDDEKELVDIGEQILKRLGYRVTATTSSAEALRLFQVNPEAFDLIITDQTMPRMTGRELAQKMLAIRPDIPVIICTGFSVSIPERQEAKTLSVRHVIMKPLVIKEMALAVRSVLDGILR
jgi:PAS domain S-box-containing protein